MEQDVDIKEIIKEERKLCSTCRSAAVYTGTFVEFDCPKCNEYVIIRCKKCKDLSNKYKCQKCGFVGP